MNYYKLTLTLLCLCLSISVYGQLNLKVGYDLGIVQSSLLEDLTDQFNAANSPLEKNLKSLKTFQGLQMGVRYKPAELIGVELSYAIKFNSFEAEKEGELFRKVFYRSNVASAGFEQFMGIFSYGATIDWNRLSANYIETGDGDKIDITDQSVYSSQFFISINTPNSGGISFTIRPYYQLFWGKYDLRPFADSFGVSNANADYGQRFSGFGIQLLFYNGKG